MNTQKNLTTRNVRIAEWLVPYDDATRNVVLERSIADVLTAKPGIDGECMNSRCIKRHRQSNIFPHPVYIVSTIKTRVYIVDQLDSKGDPSHVVRYELSSRDARLISEHDRTGSGELGALILHVPRDPKGSLKGRRSPFDQRDDFGRQKPGRRTHKPMPHGAEARFKVAVGAGLADDDDGAA